MKNNITILVSIITLLIVSSFISINDVTKANIYGNWTRDSDNLQISISKDTENNLVDLSYIVHEGNDKFPCNVLNKAIYRNIIQRSDSLWTCDFLLVTINNCSSEYIPTGKIRLTNLGQLEVICPGYKRMYYNKKRPRYEG